MDFQKSLLLTSYINHIPHAATVLFNPSHCQKTQIFAFEIFVNLMSKILAVKRKWIQSGFSKRYISAGAPAVAGARADIYLLQLDNAQFFSAVMGLKYSGRRQGVQSTPQTQEHGISSVSHVLSSVYYYCHQACGSTMPLNTQQCLASDHCSMLADAEYATEEVHHVLHGAPRRGDIKKY